MEFEKVNEIPPRPHTFKMSKETEELIAILNGMEPEEIMKFFVTELDGPDAARRESNKIVHRLQTAMKHADGYFKVSRRQYDVFVSRRE